MQLVEHALDPIRRFAHVLEKQDAAVDARKIRRPAADATTMARLPPHSVPAQTTSGPSSAHFDFVTRLVEQAEAVIERERRRHRRAEIAGHDRSGERDHAGVRECRQLERGEVAVAQPLLARPRERREIDPRQQARPAVAAAQRDREVDARIVRHAHHRREPLVVGRGKALPTRAARGIDDHLLPHRVQARAPRDRPQRDRRRNPTARTGRRRAGGSWQDAPLAPRGEELGQQICRTRRRATPPVTLA